MANSLNGFYQTLVAAATEASQALMGTNHLMDSVFLDYKPTVADIGQTLNVEVPAQVTSQVTDAGVADIALTDVSATTTPIVFNKHPYYGFQVRDFEQYNTPASLRNVFLDAAIKGVCENIDQNIAALLTTSNIVTNAAINTTGHLVTTAQFLTGYSALADQKVNVTDSQNMSFVNVPKVYSAILGDANWTQAQIAGQQLAGEAHIGGAIDTSYGAKIKLDQAMSTLNTGTAPSRTFTSAYFHRYAIALATRPLPEPDSNIVNYTYIMYKGVPIRIMIGYNQFPKMSWIVTVDSGYGLKVVRENLAQLFLVAE